MNQLIQELSFENQPIHIFEYDGKTALVAKQVADILGIANPTPCPALPRDSLGPTPCPQEKG